MSKTKNELLLEACEENNVYEAITLLLQGADVNSHGEDGYTPLHIAAEKGFEELAFLLIYSFSPDVDSKAKHAVTPLHLEALYGHYSIAKNLLAKGAAPNPYDLLGYNPLNLAHGHGSKEIVTLLEKAYVRNDTGSPSPHQDELTVTGSSSSLESADDSPSTQYIASFIP